MKLHSQINIIIQELSPSRPKKNGSRNFVKKKKYADYNQDQRVTESMNSTLVSLSA